MVQLEADKVKLRRESSGQGFKHALPLRLLHPSPPHVKPFVISAGPTLEFSPFNCDEQF
jgi:hypothetical protein